MLTIEAWAIREMGTDNYLPDCRCVTQVEPIPVQSHGLLPKLYATRKGAALALYWWRKGRFTTRHARPSYDTMYPETYIGYDVVPERAEKKMELVRVSVNFS